MSITIFKETSILKNTLKIFRDCKKYASPFLENRILVVNCILILNVDNLRYPPPIKYRIYIKKLNKDKAM